MGLLIFFGLRYHAEQTALQRDERALALVTASDIENLRLAPALGIPPETHARYRGRTGTAMAVVTFSNFPPAPVGRTYQVWVHHQERWISLGTIQPNANGAARLFAEDPVLAVLPEVVQVTLERPEGSTLERVGRSLAREVMSPPSSRPRLGEKSLRVMPRYVLSVTNPNRCLWCIGG
jgi:hypothetical protein